MSFSDLVKRANEKKKEEENQSTKSYFGSLVDKAYSGGSATKFTDDDVTRWFTSVQDAGKRAYDYLSTDEYRQPNTELASEVDRYLSDADYVLQYIRSNKGNLNDYDNLYSSAIATRNALKDYSKGVLGINNFYSQFASEDEYNTWKKSEDEKNAVLSAEDYKQLTNLGSGIDNPTWKDSFAPVEIAGWKPFGDGAEINNMVTFAEANRSEAFAASANAVRGGGGTNETTKLVNLINMYMKDEEKGIYNYYIGKGDKKKADEYLSELTETLKQREAGKMVEKVDETALELVFSALAGLDSAVSGFGNIDNFIMGTEADPTTTLQYAYSSMSSNNEGAWRVFNDLSNTTAHMLPSILAGTITGGIGGAATLGVSAVGNAYADMRNLGYDEGQSRGYAALVGASEAVLSYALGGISKLGGGSKGIFQTVANKIIPKLDNALAKVAIQIGGNMLDEGLEEAIQEVLDPVFKMVATGEDFEGIDLESVLYSGLLGALSAGMLEGAPSAYKANRYASASKKAFGGDIENILIEAGTTEGTGKAVDKYINKYGKKGDLSKWDVASLLEITDSQKVKSAIEAKLTALGETGDVGKIADIITKIRSGEDITKAEREILVNSKYGRRVSTTANPNIIKSGGYDTSWAEGIGTRSLNAEAYNRGGAHAILERPRVNVINRDDEEEEGLFNVFENKESQFKASEDGTTFDTATGEEVSINKIVSTKGGKLMVELDNGSTVDASTLSLASSEEAIMYEMVAKMEVTPDTANEIISTFKPLNAKQSLQYLSNVPLAYQYGKMGYEAGLADINLTEQQKRFAYNRGVLDAEAEVQSQPKATAPQKGKAKASKTGKNGIIYENGFTYDESTANDMQKVSMAHIEVIGKMSNLEVHVFESKMENGKRVAYVNGKLVSAPNGYFTDGNKIYIDFNAGNNGEGAMLYTMSHEVTHYIRKWNAKGFKELGDFLIAQYGKHGVPVPELIKAQKNKIKKRYKEEGKALPSEAKLFDMAYEELVADAMSDMFTDPNAYEKLAKLKKKDVKLWQKLGEAIKAVLGKLKAALGIYKTEDVPVAREAFYVRDFSSEVYEKLQDLYIKAFVEADANYEASIGSRNLNDFADAKNENGEPLFQYRAMEADEETYRHMLHKWGKMTNVQIDNLFATIDNAMELIKDNLEVLDYAWEADIDDRAFSPVKPNSDKLYQVSLDFSTLCRKRILQQTVQVQLQEALNKPLTREEGIAIRDALMALQEEGRQIEVACALCYVESARMKSPEQIKKFINNKEKVIKDFFANKSGGNIKEKIKQAEADARARLGVGNASLKSLPGKVAQEIREAKKVAKESYKPTAEEQKLIDVAKGMTVTDFTSPEGLENLAKNYPRLFDAYTSYIRNATKSKGIEGDTWWRAGDSNNIGDVLIANMNKENGLRSQSWSDFQVIHILDYIASTIELATRNTKEQAYSKVPDYVELMGLTGVMINMSLIPTAQFNGSLDYDSVEGIDYKRALELRDKYHATAGTICIGVDNVQIKLLLGDATIDYVIPYHRSGMSKALRKLMHIPTWSDYELYQSESNLSRADAEKQAEKYGVQLLDVSDPNYQRGTSFSEWFNLQEAQQIAKMENANPSDKAKHKKYGVMYGGYMAMQNAANNYLKLCAERGIAPKFSNEKADFTAEDNYWKLLIDRKMVDNVTGEVIEQQTIKPIFNEGEIMRILNDELARYPKVKADQDYAIRRVTVTMLSGEIRGGMSAKDIAKVMQKPVDNVTNVNILASVEDMEHSDRDSLGNELSKEQQDFFKDSKVRDKKGNLMVMYHGTTANFNTFKKGDVGFHFGTKGAARGRAGFGKNVTIKEVYLNITNPIVFDEDLGSWDADWRLTRELYDKGILTQADAESVLFTDDRRFKRTTEAANKKLAAVLLEKGYDGIEYSNTFETKKATTSYIVFNSNQAKEIINKAPTSNPDIRYSDRDSHGNELSAEQQKFFKDSKARDEDGNLLVLFHGTSTENRITEFMTTEAWRTGLWLTTDHESSVHFARAAQYIERDPEDDTRLFTKENSASGSGRQGVYELYANVKNPFIVDAQGKRYWEIPRPSAMGKGNVVSGEEINAFALDNGYDGVIINDVVEGSNRLGTDVIVFSPNQVKYTDNLNPTEGNDIRYSDRVIPTGIELPEGTKVDKNGKPRSAQAQRDAGYMLSENKFYQLYSAHKLTFGNRGGEISTVIEKIKRDGFISTTSVANVLPTGTMRYFHYDSNRKVKFDNVVQAKYAPKKGDYVLFVPNSYVSKDDIIKNGFKPLDYEIGVVEYDYQPYYELYSKAYDQAYKASQVLYSDRTSYAPTFYSHMGKVIDDIRLEKMGAGGVVSYLKGKGVKDEEIKWSGIETFLEGKKSVTKAELQEFVAGSQLQIEEEMSGYNKEAYDELEALWLKHAGVSLSETFSDDFDLPLTEDNMADVFDDMERDGYDVPSIEDQRHMLELARKAGNEGRWARYKLGGGTNYRELVFKMPNKSYSNDAMKAHWGQDAEGVLAHARIQDMTTSNGKKMLFVEEIQSDWHNEGHQVGYAKKLSSKEEKRVAEIEDEFSRIRRERTWLYAEMRKYVLGGEKYNALAQQLEPFTKQYQELQAELDEIYGIEAPDVVPDAPFRNNYHEYVLKRLLRMAAEEGYDSIGWTTADIQAQRWSEDYSEGYRIEYDQDIPKFLRKYGKKWGTTVGKGSANGTEIWSMDIPDSMKDSVLYEGQVLYSDRVTDQETLDFLENQEHVTVYRAMQVIEGELYPPMAAKVKSEDGKNRLVTPSEIGAWEQAVERPDLIYKGNKFKLDKANGSSIDAAYNPYFHTSASPLNDQFSSAYKRPNLVIVEGEIPKSELTSGYRAKFAKDTVGETKWHSGPVAGKLKGDKARRVFLSRWFKPVRIVPDSEVASIVAKTLEGENIDVPYNVVTPSLRAELEKVGVPIKYSDRDPDAVSNRTLLANALESVAQNDIEKNKLTQYKKRIALIESEQAKLTEARAKIKELSFAKGARDTEAIKKLQFEANQSANRINTYDRQLLDLESTTALKRVLEREKAMARKKAEQKGKDALRAYKEKAAKTQRVLMERYTESRKSAIEGRNKTAMRHKIKDVVSDLNKLLLNPTKDQHVPIGLQQVVAEALDAINMDTMNAEERVAYYNVLISKATDPDEITMLTKKRDFFEYRSETFKDRITALKNAYAEFKESDDPLIRNAHNDAIEDLIKNTADAVGNKSLKDMSLEQLEAVYDMYKAIRATVKNANKMFKEGRQQTVSENSEAVKDEVRKVGGHKDRVLKITKFLKKFGWNMLKPITAMKAIGSKTFEKLFDNVRAGEDTWAVDVNEAKRFYEAVSEKYGYKKWDFKTRYTFTDSAGHNYSISLEQMMSLYAYSKREQADKHLEFGGFIFDDAIEVTERKGKFGIPLKYEVNDANPYTLKAEQIADVVGKLTPAQKAFIDEMQTYLSETMGAKGNEVSLALYDIKLYKEKNYFPLKTARYFREFDPEQSATPKIKNSGFSKKTVPKAGNPIVLSNFMDVWASHVNDMSMYHAFVLPLEDFMRVYNYSSTAGGYDSVQQYIKNAYGSQANQYIERLMDDLNGGARVDSSADVINKGLALFKKSSVFASASVVVQQPSAIARAFAYINPKYFVTSAGSALNLTKHKALWEEVKKYAPVAVIKEMGYFDTGVGRSTVEWIKGNQTIKDKVDDALAKAPAIADELSWSYIWLAVKNEVKSTTNLTPGTEEFLKRVGERFTEIITNTQVYDSVLARSGMMRSKDTGMKMATAFMAEPTTTVNMMVDGILQGKRGNKKFTAATVGAVSSSIILNSILVALVYAARDDDEDETYAEKYIGSLTTELLDGFNPLTYIPLVKDIWSIAQGYDVERSDMSVVSKLWAAVENLFNENTSGWEKVTEVAGAISSVFGIPLKNILRDAKAMYNLAETATSGTKTTNAGIAEAVKDSFTSSIPLWDRFNEPDTNSDRLYRAIMSGDQAQIDRVKSRFKDDKAIESAMRQALREHDSRIYEAAQARYEGDIAEYTRIAKEIIAEGNFSQDTVVAAINSEITAIKNGESSESEPTEDKDEATSIYKASDVNAAFDNGDYSVAHDIINDLVKTKVANGMTEKEANSSLRSSMTSYWKPLYKQAYQSGNSTETARIRKILYASGLYGNANDVVKTTADWLKN